MTQQEIENIMRDFNAELRAERSKKVNLIQDAYFAKIKEINENTTQSVQYYEKKIAKNQEAMSFAKCKFIKARGTDKETEMQCQFEQLRTNFETNNRELRRLIADALQNGSQEKKCATETRDMMMRNLAMEIEQKKTAKRAELEAMQDKPTNAGFIHIAKNGKSVFAQIYTTEEEAMAHLPQRGVLKTIKIQW